MNDSCRFATGRVHDLREFRIRIHNRFEAVRDLPEEFVVRAWKNRYDRDGLQVEPQPVDWVCGLGGMVPISARGGDRGEISVQIPWGEDFEKFSLGYRIRGKSETYVSIAENLPDSLLRKGGDGYRYLFHATDSVAAPEGSIRVPAPFAGKGRWHPAHPFALDPDQPVLFVWRCEIPALVDLHCHVQSNHCAPLPAAWVHTWDATTEIHAVQPGYRAQDLLLQLPFLGMGEMAEVTTRSSLRIAARFSDEFASVDYPSVFPFLRDAPAQIACLLPMDMEYMHFDGYFGIPVSREFEAIRHSSGMPEKTRWYCWNRIWEFSTNNGPIPGRPDLPCTFRQSPPSQRGETWSFMDPEDSGKYEEWSKQIKVYRLNSIIAMHRSQFPFQHFDPRRYTRDAQAPQLDVESDEYGPLGLEKVLQDPIHASPQGKFFGYKLYTTLGWAPMDPLLRDPLERFYAHCEAFGVPLVNHGTPAGFYTHDRRHYLDLLLREGERSGIPRVIEGRDDRSDGAWTSAFAREVPAPDGSWVKPRSRGERPPDAPTTDPEAVWWYIHHYVSPQAWKPVVRRFPRLRLDLAHFGDSDHFHSGQWDKRKHREPRSMRSRRLEIAFSGGELDPHRTHRFLLDLIDLIQPDNAVFADLSYVVLDRLNAGAFTDLFEWARRRKPILLERILWGTDWPLVGDEPMLQPRREGNMLHRYARGFRKALPSLPADFFIRACFLNPVQFLDLAKIRNIRILGRKSDPWPWIQGMDERLLRLDPLDPSLRDIDKAAIYYQTHPEILGKDGL